jgi:hypothetical protein
VRVSPTRPGDEHYRHDGEEWIFLLSGSLTLSLAGRTYDLAPGDAAHFDSRLPHRLIARGSNDADVLLVASPVSNPAPPGAGWLAPTKQTRAIPGLRRATFFSTLSSRINLSKLSKKSPPENLHPR